MKAWRARMATALGALALAAIAHAAPLKVLRVAFPIAETNFDPAATSDIYSGTIQEEIFESPLTYDFLARPAKVKPQTAAALPTITDGGRTYTLHLRKGIDFADDPVFAGRKRELTARDYEYAFKRLMDPVVSSPNLWLIEGRLAGVTEAVARARKAGHFDYDAPVAGLEVVDRYTLRFHLLKPDYTFLYILAMPAIGAQAREVVEHYGADIGAHPVGTGAFRLAEWKRSSRIVLEKNAGFREEHYEAEPPADDALSQKLYAEMKGKRIPQVDRVEVSIIEESQPRYLAFLNDELDLLALPYEFMNVVLPAGKPAPWLVKRGIRAIEEIEPTISYLYFNMRDPTFGGYTPEKIALRRAISLAYDNQEEIHLLRNGMAVELQEIAPPGVEGHDPHFSLGRTYDPARAKALLDMFGYIDRDGDGWRDMPDGSPLVFHYPTQPDQLSRLFTQLWKKDLDAIGVRMDVQIAKWPDQRKQSKLGKLQLWDVGWSADYPDADNFYQLLYGPNCGSSNDGCFALRAYDALYEKARGMPQGPERTAVYDEMAKLITAYAPVKLHTAAKVEELVEPWVLGWRRHPILLAGWRYADIDVARQARGH